MSKAVLAWLGVLFVAMGITFVWLGIKYSLPAVEVRPSHSAIDQGYEIKPPSASEPILTEFTLTERSGRKLGTADLAGRVSVTNFFFSTCPAECLTQQRQYEIVQKEFGPKGVQFVSITCDPENDTPSRFNKYVAEKRFDIANNGEAWWFLTGDLTYIQRIAEEIYQVPLKRFTHTEKFEVRDKWNNPRGSFSWKDGKSLVDLKLTLDKLLVETEPPPEVKAAAAERTAMIERAITNAKAAKEGKPAAEPKEEVKPAEEAAPAEAPKSETPAP
ncbi:SCO family protein [Anatilimnocola floriformis]|uniref:SCO family protein n=1 Tax=Anatilimnocola floriformis TaxID=2948575 RepID=UPI0020C356B1|nr:SCO family protein [Anatilimnocola floriformis]